MTIVLPSLPFGTSTEIALHSSSVDQTPYLGGPIQRLSRLGDRWRLKVDCRKMYARQAGVLIAVLIQGLGQKVTCVIPQPGTDMSLYSDGTVTSAVTGGRVVNHTGGGATKYVGQYVSIVKSGVRYLHMIVGVSGADLTLHPPLKVALAGGETMEFGAPKIEGFLSGNEQSWTIGLAENLGVTFTIGEAQ